MVSIIQILIIKGYMYVVEPKIECLSLKPSEFFSKELHARLETYIMLHEEYPCTPPADFTRASPLEGFSRQQ